MGVNSKPKTFSNVKRKKNIIFATQKNCKNYYIFALLNDIVCRRVKNCKLHHKNHHSYSAPLNKKCYCIYNYSVYMYTFIGIISIGAYYASGIECDIWASLREN